MKRILFALAGLAVAAVSLAQLTKYKDWDKSPEAYFLTSTERGDWKKVATDQDAEQFIALYWAKRGGEAFKQEVARRIGAADQQFKLARYHRGADSVRGRILVVMGPPSRVSQQRAQDNQADDTGGVTAPAIDTRFQETGSAVVYTWIYDKARLDPALGINELRVQIAVDAPRGTDELRNGAQVEKAISTIAEKSIVNPNATVNPATAAAAAASPAVQAPPAGAPAAAPPAPAGAAKPPAAGAPATGAPAAGAPAAGAPAAAPPPPAPAAALPLPDAVKSALQAAAPKGTGEAGFWSGVFRSNAGDPFLALQFYLPSDKTATAPGSPLKLAGLIQDASGKEVQSFWEDANFSEVSQGTRKDRAIDRSVALPPGSYKGTFGLFKAEGEPPVAASTVPFELPAPSPEFQVSPLILSNGLVPLTKRPGPTDPFVFGTDKPIKVEPKGDHNFSKQDSLWYFYTVANPGQPAAAAGGAAPAPPPAASTTTPAVDAAAPGAAAPGAAPADASTPAPKPRIMTRINVQRDGQDAFAPFTGPADMQPIGPNYFGTGSEIPLASFEPGYYAFLINVRDLNAARGSAANKGIDRKQEFVVLMPDGSMPPKKAAAAPAPAAKPTPKKP